MVAIVDVERVVGRRAGDLSRVGWSDRVVALLLLPLIAVLLGVIWLIVVPLQGRPFLYSSERMRGMGQSFRLLKIRTMIPAKSDDDDEDGPLGGHCSRRVTWAGQILRRYRLDELPQILNILRGDMRFIGPRPPLRRYIEAYPAVYREILKVPPGVTGLATVVLHGREERLLATCLTAAETDDVYRTRCIAVKARLDRIYMRRRSARLDAYILWRTIAGLMTRKRALREAISTKRHDASSHSFASAAASQSATFPRVVCR